MEIDKSSRHQKIIGDFGENLICNWLSRSGFEVTIVDHTGIDLIAYHPSSHQRLGITVKSRTRTAGKEDASVNVFSYQGGRDDRRKVKDACQAFACEPWIAIYVEATDYAEVYLTSLENYDQKYRGKKRSKASGGLTSRCSGHGYRELSKVRFSFAVVSAVVGSLVSAAPPLSSNVSTLVKHYQVNHDQRQLFAGSTAQETVYLWFTDIWKWQVRGIKTESHLQRVRVRDN